MESKLIDFGHGYMPRGFSERLASCFGLVTIDALATPDFKDLTFPVFLSEDDHNLVTSKGIQHVNYRELGRFELLDAVFSKGDYFHSFYIAENIFAGKGGTVRLVALLYEERGRIHIWNPTFEELFLPLICDDLDNDTDAHWRSLQEIHERRSRELDVYAIALQNEVDYEICWDKGETFTTVVYYALLKHIFLVEDEKYPTIPGSDRTLQAYEDLYCDYVNDRVDLARWRKKYNLKNPWV